MDQNGPKWTKMDQSDLISVGFWFVMAVGGQLSYKWSEISYEISY